MKTKFVIVLFLVVLFACRKDNNEPNNIAQQDTIPQQQADYRDYIVGTYYGTYQRTDINGFHTGTDTLYVEIDPSDTNNIIFESILYFGSVSCVLKSDSSYSGWSGSNYMSGNVTNKRLYFFYDPSGLGAQPTHFNVAKL